MELDVNGHSKLKACRTELSNPEVDWQQSWKLASQPGLSSEEQTFLWRMLHNILPTQSRLHRLGMRNAPTPNCIFCERLEPDVLHHALLTCPKNKEVTDWLLSTLRPHLPNPQPQQIVLLNLEIVDEKFQLAVVWMISNVLSLVWQTRKDKKTPNLFQTRAILEARISILRKTRFMNPSTQLSTMLSPST